MNEPMSFDQWFHYITTHEQALAYNNPLGLPTDGDLRGAAKLGWDAAVVNFKLQLQALLPPVRALTGVPLFDAGTDDACEKIEAWLNGGQPRE